MAGTTSRSIATLIVVGVLAVVVYTVMMWLAPRDRPEPVIDHGANLDAVFGPADDAADTHEHDDHNDHGTDAGDVPAP